MCGFLMEALSLAIINPFRSSCCCILLQRHSLDMQSEQQHKPLRIFSTSKSCSPSQGVPQKIKGRWNVPLSHPLTAQDAQERHRAGLPSEQLWPSASLLCGEAAG